MTEKEKSKFFIIIKIWISALLWELPQTILSFFIFLYFLVDIQTHTLLDNFVYLIVIDNKKFSGVSLGRFIFLDKRYANYTTIRHEVGHSYQSLIFGWLYLLVIGIPSIIRSHIKMTSKKYYAGFPESWADSIMGIIREKND